MAERLTPFGLSPDEIDAELVRAGLMTEEERISAGYARIHARQLRRRGLSGRRALQSGGDE